MDDEHTLTGSEGSLLDRLRQSVSSMRAVPGRSTAATPLQEIKVRDAVRQLSRNRVSQVLRQLRATRGLSYDQVKEQTGISLQVLYDVEYRDRRLTLEELRLLAHCYDVGINDILGVDVDQ
ncbi:MAG: helix-turn-helix domain-containing protein [Caldilineaceae bacterium]|nr:helix-turn-helix domain-containing protein [Caldilineaceae bacterium]